MHKKLLLILLLFSSTLLNIFAKTYTNDYKITLDAIVDPISYSLSLLYDNVTYTSTAITDGTFSDGFTSKLFTVVLSEGNEIQDLQFTVKVKPANFFGDVTTNYYDTDFKPTPRVPIENIEPFLEIDHSTFDKTDPNKILSITSISIPSGRNEAQPIAYFYLGWEKDDPDLPLVSFGTYTSTTTVEYTTEQK